MSWTWTLSFWRRLASSPTRSTGHCWVSTLLTSSSDLRRAAAGHRVWMCRPPRRRRLRWFPGPVPRHRPRPRLFRRSANVTRLLGHRPRVRRHRNCPRPSVSIVLPLIYVRGPQLRLHNVQADLRVVSKLRSPLLRLPLLSGHLVVSRPRVATLL
ncbi:hypothetical protein PF005_g16488 [Phytophthora fragariae]|uniref:Uncharacterized protein n=1 Tax=Phytophthora fragariae TaxID=53985 RepID=A0A6A3EEE2_9STRA|nr:hypothetical protein PF009_g17843 [Phytophthora fragariae]KAE9080792.1 hypothetical protein PF007_g22902 [Phytophthora fragariae]KAE9131165.1 hypothetical protein PF006_g15585 [Phytophthora fragariae]KAE9197496.1 hypothetical protein PF005_g16488 [Phytophthora fragariae]KAE9212914.1 hypothetical protein PF004_g15493 [Phytophthora fragariae]